MSEPDLENKPGWKTSVIFKISKGIRYPRIMWSYNLSDGTFAGSLFARPVTGSFALRTSKRIEEKSIDGHLVTKDGHSLIFGLEQSEELIRIVSKKFGWTKPPFFEEVLQDVISASSKSPASRDEAKSITEELIKKWKAMIAT